MLDPRTDAELFARAQQGESEDDEQAWEAIHELRRRGSREIFDGACSLLRSSTPRARGRGADILAQLGEGRRSFPKESVDALLAALDGETEAVVLEAIAVGLGHNHDSRAVAALLPLRNHSSDEVRVGVVMGIMNYPQAVDALLELSRDRDDDVRNWATFGLGTLLDEREAPVDTAALREALVDRLADPVDEVRGEALAGLAVRKDPRVFEPLREALGAPSVGILAVEAAEKLADRRLLPELESLAAVPGDNAFFESTLAHAIATLTAIEPSPEAAE